MEKIVRICKVEGCKNVGELNKKYGGKSYRRPLCTTHKRRLYGQVPSSAREKIKKYKESKNNTCQLCGWVGPCDVHRKTPRVEGGSYTDGNMICICPNCHRLEHKGLITLPK